MYIQLSRNDGHNDVEYEITYNNALRKPIFNMTYDDRWHSQYHIIYCSDEAEALRYRNKIMIKHVNVPYYINSTYLEY